jgi:hypothetical protein
VKRIDPILWDRAVASLPLGSSVETLAGDVGITLEREAARDRLLHVARFLSFLGGTWELHEEVRDFRGITFWYRRLP